MNNTWLAKHDRTRNYLLMFQMLVGKKLVLGKFLLFSYNF